MKHTMTDRTPYTYLIRFKVTGQVYYGCRYALNCHPSDLFASYFTSSKVIKNLIQAFGAGAFEYEVRKVFSDKRKCIRWEQRILRKFEVLTNRQFLNKDHNANLSNAIQNKFKTRSISNPATGKCIRIIYTDIIPEGWVQGNINNFRPSNNGKKWYVDPLTERTIYATGAPEEHWVVGRPTKFKEKLSASKKADNCLRITDGTRDRMHPRDIPIPEGWRTGTTTNGTTQGRIWITDGVASKYIGAAEELPTGWKPGRRSWRSEPT